VLLAGEGSETMPEHEAMPSEQQAGARPGPLDPGGVRGLEAPATERPPVHGDSGGPPGAAGGA